MSKFSFGRRRQYVRLLPTYRVIAVLPSASVFVAACHWPFPSRPSILDILDLGSPRSQENFRHVKSRVTDL